METGISRKKRNAKKIFVLCARYVLMSLFLLFFLFPFFAMLTRSFMADSEINFFPKIFPSGLDFTPYQRAFNAKTAYWFLNTLVIEAINIVGTVLSASLCAYGFAKLNFPGKNFWFGVTLATMMLPSITMQIPLYLIYTKLGWVGTWFPLTLPCFFGGGAVTIFMMRQFMRGIPHQISEAARLDGADKLMIYFRIIVPMCMPIISYTMVTTFIGVWNDFMTPLMYLSTSESKYTISLGLYYSFKLSLPSKDNFVNVQMAAGVLMMLPCMVLFFIFQKQLIDGVTMGSVKG